MTNKCEIRRRTLIIVFSWLVVTILLFLPASKVQSASSDLSQVIGQVVSAYNNQDATAYRQTFGKKLESEFSLEQMREILSTRMKDQGPIVSHRIEPSPDGKRALVFLDMEDSKVDLHIRVDQDNKIVRLIWLLHKTDPSANILSGHQQHQAQEKYQPYVDKFFRAIRDTNAEALLSLMAEDEDDDWSLEDYQSFLVQINDRGISEIGDIEVLTQNEVLVPVFSEQMDMGFYLGFDETNKISSLKISNYAPNETRGLSYASLGVDTLRTSDLNSFDQLRDAFASDSGKIRFVTLLSPT